MTPNAAHQRAGNSERSDAVGAPLHALDTDTRPRVLPGLVTSIHHRKNMLCTVQALLAALTGLLGRADRGGRVHVQS